MLLLLLSRQRFVAFPPREIYFCGESHENGACWACESHSRASYWSESR